MNPIRKIITILLLSLFLFGYHTCDHYGPDSYGTYGNTNTYQRPAVTCFKQSEYTSGFNKICNYSCLGSARAITIGNTQLCPLTIRGN